MKKLIFFAFMGIIFSILFSGTSVHAQGLDDLLEQPRDQETMVQPIVSKETIGTPPPIKGKGALGGFIDWLVGKKVLGEDNVVVRVWRKREAQWEKDKRIIELKNEIQKNYQITIGEGPMENNVRSKDVKSSDWTVEELEGILQTLSSESDGFRKATKRIFKGKEKPGDPRAVGVVFGTGLDSVYLFDLACHDSKGNPDLPLLKQTLVHEQTHAFTNANPGILEKFAKQFWRDYNGGSVPLIEIDESGGAFPTPNYSLPKGMYALGATVSWYGASQVLPMGTEDLAETSMVMFCDPKLLENFPERRGFLMDNFPDSGTLYKEAHIPEINANLAKYYIFRWPNNGPFNNKEMFSYSYFTQKSNRQWAFIVPLMGMDAKAILEQMREQLGLPPFDEEN
ncbi:MAG: hypothetical protein WA705_15360 [Candidatus Ozemobacteraceae bacterium]